MNTGSSKERSIELPSWEEATAHVKGGTANALEKFIHHQEPAVFCGEDEFRAQLLDVLKQERGFWESEACQCIKCSSAEPLPAATGGDNNARCSECGMKLHDASEYHPFAACLMFRASGDRQVVLANLSAVIERAAQPPNAFDKCGYCGSSEFECIHCAARRTAQPPGAEVERMQKLFYLAAQQVIFFSTYDPVTDSWPDIGEFYCPCVNLSDTFAYACADGERLDDSEIDRLIRAHKEWGYDGVVAWASLIRKCEPIEPHRTPKYHEARAALTKSDAQ
jgi:hypothetical protein